MAIRLFGQIGVLFSMNKNPVLPKDKKLTVNLLIEPGCLGPNGTNHVENFCLFAEKMFATFSSDYVSWDFAPREKKSLPEISYSVSEKKLALDQVSKYLQIFKLDRENFEEQLNDRLAFLIEQYLQR